MQIARRQGQESDIKIMCPKCLELKPREGHHIFPKEFWGKQPYGPFLYLCSQCHWGLQRIVHFPYLEKEQILELTREWLAQ